MNFSKTCAFVYSFYPGQHWVLLLVCVCDCVSSSPRSSRSDSLESPILCLCLCLSVSLAIRPHRPSPLEDLLDCILCSHSVHNTKNTETLHWKRVGVCVKKEPSRRKKEACAFSAVTSRVATPKSFLLRVEGAMRPSLDDALANLSTSSSRLFYQRPTTKNTR